MRKTAKAVLTSPKVPIITRTDWPAVRLSQTESHQELMAPQLSIHFPMTLLF